MVNPFFANKFEQAVKEQGCPLCFMRQQAEAKYIRSIIADHVNDPASRVHIINSLGYCPRHSWQIVEVEKQQDGETLGSGIIYEHLTKVIIERLDDLRRYPKTLARTNNLTQRFEKLLPSRLASSPLRTETPCRVCVMGAESDDSYVRWMLEGLSDTGNDETRRLYQESNRVCFEHLRQALDKATSTSAPGLEFLLEDTLSTLQNLDTDLRGHIAKYDWDKKGTPRTEAEQFSWMRAIYFFAGRRDKDNPKPGFSKQN